MQSKHEGAYFAFIYLYCEDTYRRVSILTWSFCSRLCSDTPQTAQLLPLPYHQLPRIDHLVAITYKARSAYFVLGSLQEHQSPTIQFQHILFSFRAQLANVPPAGPFPWQFYCNDAQNKNGALGFYGHYYHLMSLPRRESHPRNVVSCQQVHRVLGSKVNYLINSSAILGKLATTKV